MNLPARKFPMEAFADVLEANGRYSAAFTNQLLTGQAMRGLAIVTCIDSRIAPLEIVGMSAGDAKILRNAGARVTDDVLRTLVLAVHLLGVARVLVMPHTDCRMASGEESQVHAAILAASGIDSRSLEIRTVTDQHAALIADIQRIRSFPYLPSDLVVGGAIFDVATGRLTTVDA
ncbi:MAG: beta-class carbonic anhydrase [Candidatus Nanopelagicales bacterium]